MTVINLHSQFDNALDISFEPVLQAASCVISMTTKGGLDCRAAALGHGVLTGKR